MAIKPIGVLDRGCANGADSLGTINEPMSPLVMGVNKLTIRFGPHAQGVLANGAVVVAQWASGKPLIVRGKIKGRNRVDLNLYPVSGGDQWVGDGANLMRNALLYQ